MAIFRFKEDKQEERVAISKKAMRRIIDSKDYEIKRTRNDSEKWRHLAQEEQIMVNDLQKRLQKQIMFTWLYGLSGVALGAGLTWLIL